MKSNIGHVVGKFLAEKCPFINAKNARFEGEKKNEFSCHKKKAFSNHDHD